MDDVKPVALGRSDTQAPVMLSGVDRLGEKLGRRLRAILEPMAGGKPQVLARAVEIADFGLWSRDLPPHSSIGVYRMLPMKGHILLRIDAAMVSALVDCFYGGVPARAHAPRGEFTPAEERLVARLSDAFIARLVDCWSDTLRLEPGLVARETGVGYAATLPPSEMIAIQRFTVSLTSEESWPIDVIYPLSALRTVEPFLETKISDEPDRHDPVWRGRIARQMADIRLPARTVLARPSLSLADLMQLKAGDVIPVAIHRSLPLIVGDRIVAHGSIGEQDGRAAFRIEKLAQGMDR
jgi:flagellar motor switch protein FliM